MVKLKDRSMSSYVKCRVTVIGDVRALVLFHEFFIHVKVDSGKLKIARYVVRDLNLTDHEYKAILRAEGEVLIKIKGSPGSIKVEPIPYQYAARSQ